MRILVVTTAHHPRYDCQALLYEYFAEQPGNEVTVVAPSTTDVTRGSRPLPEREDYGRVHVRRLYRDIPEMWQRPFARAEEFVETVREARPDVIWCWHEGNYPLAKYASELTGAPVVLYLEFPSETILKRSRNDGVPAVLSCVRTHRRIEKAMTWGGQYFLQVNAPAGVPKAESYWQDEKINRGIFVGSLGYGYKDPEHFMALLPRLFEETPMEEFMLISSGSEFPRKILEEYGSRYKIDYRPHATREEIFEEIAKSKFSVTTMRGEWPGAFPCESWALKTPVFAAGGSMGGMIEDGVSGVLSLDGVKRLYEDHALYRRIQEEGYKRYLDEYATEAVGDRCLRVFDGLVQDKMEEVWEELRWHDPQEKASENKRVVVRFAPSNAKPLRIGLQIPKAGTFSKMVWGDEILAEGLADALSQLDIVDQAVVYTPVTIHSNLDLVLSFYPYPETLFVPEAANFWWLQAGVLQDESLSKIDAAIALYEDFFAAGTGVAKWLRQYEREAAFMLMGADLGIYRPYPPAPQYRHNIVFIGNNYGRDEILERYLLPLVPLGLRIYGSGWEDVPELGEAFLGSIHPREVPKVYSSAKIVLSVHKSWHARMDIPTTRLWEATACGAAVVSDPVSLGKQIFGDAIVWSEGGRDLVEKVQFLLENDGARQALKARARLHALRTGGFQSQAVLLLSRYGRVADPEARSRERLKRLCERGEKLASKGSTSEARACYEVALQLDPASGEAANGLGAVLWAEGRQQQALEFFRRAVENDPGNADALYNLVVAAHQTGALDLLERTLRSVLSTDPTRVDVLPILADVEIRRGRTREAESLLERAIRLEPDNQEARRVLEDLRRSRARGKMSAAAVTR